MKADGEPVAGGQIQARRTKSQPGTQHGDQGCARHVKRKVNAKLNARPGNRQSQQGQRQPGPARFAVHQKAEGDSPQQRQVVARE